MPARPCARLVLIRPLLAVLLVVLAGGCTSGGGANRLRPSARTISFAGVVPTVFTPGQTRVAVASIDRRRDILEGRKITACAGFIRDEAGQLQDVTTASGEPLASEFTLALAAGLAAAGYDTVPLLVRTTSGPATEELQERLAEVAAARSLVLRVHQWTSDTFVATTLHYDLELLVADAQTNVLATQRITGRDQLGGPEPEETPLGHARATVPPALNAKLASLLAAPNIVAALR